MIATTPHSTNERWQVIPDAPIKQWRPTTGGGLAHRGTIIGTDLVTWSAYMPTREDWGRYSTFTHLQPDEAPHLHLVAPVRLGDMTSERLPADVDGLPSFSPERFIAADDWQRNLRRLAFAAIVSAFPEAARLVPDGVSSGDYTATVAGAARQASIENWRGLSAEYRTIALVGDTRCVCCGSHRYRALPSSRCRQCTKEGVAPPAHTIIRFF